MIVDSLKGPLCGGVGRSWLAHREGRALNISWQKQSKGSVWEGGSKLAAPGMAAAHEADQVAASASSKWLKPKAPSNAGQAAQGLQCSPSHLHQNLDEGHSSLVARCLLRTEGCRFSSSHSQLKCFSARSARQLLHLEWGLQHPQI